MLINFLEKLNSKNLFIITCLFTLLFFWPGLSGGFIFDDYHNIVTNANIQIKELTIENLWKAANGYSGGTRQLAMISFALNAYWAGLDPWAYKFTGLMVHALNAALVFLLVDHLARITLPLSERQRRFASLAAALAWALHPIQVSSALYVVQRMETLCYTFIIISLLLYLYARRQQIDGKNNNIFLWVGFFTCACLSALFKENAVLIPLFTLSLEFAVLKFSTHQSKKQKLWLWVYGIGIAFSAIAFIFWIIPQNYRTTPYPGRDFNTPERLLTQARVLWMYVQQILLPLPKNLYFYYDDLTISRGWLNPLSTIFAAVSWAGIALITVAIRNRFPLAALGVFWFLSAHFITSNVVGLEMVFEHRNYFALLGIILILINFIYYIPTKDGPNIKYIGIACIVIGFSVLGAIRAATWGNVLLLATDMVSKNPNSARAAMDLGVAYYEISGGDPNSPFYQFAASQFNRASTLKNSSAQPDVNLILMHAGGGFPEDFIDIDKVWHNYLDKLKNLHLGVETRTSIWTLLEQRQKEKPINDEKLQTAIQIITERERLQSYQYAIIADYYLNKLNKKEEAEQYYEKAIQLAQKEGHEDLIKKIIEDLFLNGNPDIAIKYMDFSSKK